MDPLSLLKDFNLQQKLDQVALHGDRVNFGNSYVFSKVHNTGVKSVQKDFYTLEVVLYLLLNRHLPHAEYIKQASGNKIGTVTITDRKKLLDFLDGKAELQLDTTEGLLPSIATHTAGAAEGGEAEEPASKRARTDDLEESAVDVLTRQERQLRNRNTMLLAPNKNFLKVLEVAQRAVSAYKHQAQAAAAAVAAQQKQQQQQQVRPDKGRPPSGAPVTAQALVKPSGRFDRENTADQMKEMGGEAAANLANVISMYGYSGQQQQQQQRPPAPPPPPPQPAAGSRHPSGHSGSKPGHGQPAGANPSKPQPPVKPPAAPVDKAKGGIPIIIVPSGLSAMINMFNAKAFLEEGRYETSEEAQRRSGGVKPSLLLINRTALKPAGTRPVPYHVVDKPPAKGSDDWKRVVAVVAQGVKWQFKDWPYKGAAEGDLVDTFSKVAGFFVHYSDEKVPELVANWNVKRLGLHRANRHLDTTTILDLYRTLDSFLAARKSQLAY
mmetsp:Transcript_5007/g.10824  ORF Transcript_5007/g.10824 Transcript_5007/m.10824 type:complete len:494 (-) Transcript_5007:500-1981(-)|eukprot:CAMPEP_0202912164 /NCGR_PEP_ID=MMETSP1392-20130828/56961_1 /ASSEMBLY_ACC=CAM_ASM_000868 /TAXON_ID=225041 /ORGANISM="Chlamydomonas chlamydogama, Strain SAG 11-48b" /LENGTH=493 /DNA_ID=CAMNT_0049602967 /DNA_START=112 /DNA_END=1593 /DNA_ORIENTATION=+